MSAHYRTAFLLAAILLPLPSAWGQPPALPPGPTGGGEPSSSLGVRPIGGATDGPGRETRMEGTANPPPTSPEPPAPPEHFLRQAKLDYTWLPGGRVDGLQINDVELTATFALPLKEDWAPLLLTPYAAGHFWQGPKGTAAPDLPSSLYDLNVEIGWRPCLARWLFTDLAVTPGVYSDFKTVNSDTFQMRGRGIAIVAFSPQWQLALGGMYVNRNKTKFLPAGGVIWSPCEESRCFLVFPQPKVSYLFARTGTTQWSAYVAGEFGGGRWIVERADGRAGSLDYSDLRLNFGLESVWASGLKGHVEAGYVFGRRVNFSSDTPDFKPPDTLMLRAGIRY